MNQFEFVYLINQKYIAVWQNDTMCDYAAGGWGKLLLIFLYEG